MTRYAQATTVPVEKSRAEIEKILVRYGAASFAYMMDLKRAAIAFQANGRQIRFVLPLPEVSEFVLFMKGRTRYRRSEAGAKAAWEQACRQRWRALALAIKAKLEAVESHIATFDDEFAAYIVLANGQTVGEWLVPQISEATARGELPPLLIGHAGLVSGSCRVGDGGAL